MPASAPPRPPRTVGAPAGARPVEAEDAVLVRRAAAGDGAAFEELFRRHRPAVHAHAARMLQDHGRAEDVVQDVFLSAVGAIRSGERPEHVRAWLRAIAGRACIDQWRQTTRRGEVSLDEPERLGHGDVARLTDDEWLTRTTDDRESLLTLRRAFADLPALQHAVLVQRELEGRSPAEIADRLGISRTVVEGQLARGRRTLAQAYRELQSGERCVAALRLCDASLDGRLGVRDRHRLTTHLRGCDPCRRHAHAHGVEARLIPRSLVARATMLLPLPLLRRWPVEVGLTGETATGALSAKVLAGAAVLAAGGGGVYAAGDLPRGGHQTVSHAAARVAHASRAGVPAAQRLRATASGSLLVVAPAATTDAPAVAARGVVGLLGTPGGLPAADGRPARPAGDGDVAPAGPSAASPGEPALSAVPGAQADPNVPVRRGPVPSAPPTSGARPAGEGSPTGAAAAAGPSGTGIARVDDAVLAGAGGTPVGAAKPTPQPAAAAPEAEPPGEPVTVASEPTPSPEDPPAGGGEEPPPSDGAGTIGVLGVPTDAGDEAPTGGA